MPTLEQRARHILRLAVLGAVIVAASLIGAGLWLILHVEVVR